MSIRVAITRMKIGAKIKRFCERFKKNVETLFYIRRIFLYTKKYSFPFYPDRDRMLVEMRILRQPACRQVRNILYQHFVPDGTIRQARFAFGQGLRSDKVIPCSKYPDKFNLSPYIGTTYNLVPTCTNPH